MSLYQTTAKIGILGGFHNYFKLSIFSIIIEIRHLYNRFKICVQGIRAVRLLGFARQNKEAVQLKFCTKGGGLYLFPIWVSFLKIKQLNKI